MDKRLGLPVLYTNSNGVTKSARIDTINDDGTVDLIVFVREIDGFRNDQNNVNYSDILTPNTWSNI